MSSKYTRQLILALLLLSTVSCFSQDWASTQIDSIASIKFPATPKDIPVGTNSELLASDENGVYLAMAVKLEDYSISTGDSLSVFYADVVTGMQTSVKISEIQTKDFVFNGLHGLEVDYKLPENQQFARTRILLLRGSLYSISVITTNIEKLKSVTFAKFFGSFTVK